MTQSTSETARQSMLRHLLTTLFDFEALPGRFPLSLREPRVLFDCSHEVLLLAAGRPVEALAVKTLDVHRVQRASCFFVRTAMLRPGADHYTLLGLQRDFHKEALRDHYRILIRLTHPDFVTSGAWPSGAATRINLAHDVLSSVVRRAEYDRALGAGVKGLPAVRSLTAVLPRPQAQRRWTPRACSLAGAGIAAVAGLLTVAYWPASMGVADEVKAAQADSSGNGRMPAAVEPVAERFSKPAAAVSRDLKAKAVREDDATIAARQAQAARLAQLAKTAQDAEAARAVQIAKAAQAIREVEATQLAQAAKTAKEAQLAQAAKLAQANRDAEIARAAQVAQEAKLAQTVKATQDARMVQEAQTVKLAQATQSALEAQALSAAKAARVSQEAPVLALASAKPAVLPVHLPQAQPGSEVAAKLALVDVQPVLNQLIQAMQAGRGEDLLRDLDRSIRQSRGATDLVNAYNLLVSDSRAVRLGPVQLKGRATADQLAVDGVVQLVLHDQGQPPPVRELRWRATFVQRDGKAVMTELSAGGARP